MIPDHYPDQTRLAASGFSPGAATCSGFAAGQLAYGLGGFHNKLMHYLLTLSLLFLVPASIQAEESRQAGTRIALSASVEAVLPNDEVVVSFRVEKQGTDAGEIRQYVNRVTSRIQKRLESESGVKLVTTGRYLRPVWKYPKHGERVRVGWQMLQTGQITSQRLDEVAGWLADIEEMEAQLSGLQFRISSTAMAEAQESQRLLALKKFRQKAVLMASGLGAESFRILRLNTDSRLPQPVMQHREMAMMASAPDAEPPALSAGEGVVRVTVNGEIELPFIDYPVDR